jgi:beta-N-acetylhexosaminidase
VISRSIHLKHSSSDLSQVGLHFVIGLQKSITLTDHDKRLLSQVRPAGIILFRENFNRAVPYEEWLTQLRSLVNDARACAEREDLLVSIDHEGGKVFRPPPPITNFGPAATWAARGREVGAAMGLELRSLGINLNYAPVVDINTNPNNPVIGSRAFGTTTDDVCNRSVAFLQSLEEGGVIGCPKHFPGHGDTEVDSHYEQPVIARSLNELRQRELLPFLAMVRAGAKLIMSGHILCAAVDSARPATFSHNWLTGVLRQELGFQGVITTDDVGMGAVSDAFESADAAVTTLRAGCDLILMSAHWGDTNQMVRMAGDLLAGLRDGRLNSRLFEASEERVLNLLKAATAHSVAALPESVFAAHRTLVAGNC